MPPDKAPRWSKDVLRDDIPDWLFGLLLFVLGLLLGVGLD